MSTSLAPTQPTETLASTFQVLTEWSDHVIANLPRTSDDELIAMLRDAWQLERCAFVVRGACAVEATKRVKERTGGDGSTVGREMARIAKAAGVAPSTIEYDRQIVETFGLDTLREYDDLSREHFRLALPTDSPQAMLDMARAKKVENPSYNIRNYRDDVEGRRGGKTAKVVEDAWWINEKLESDEARAAWAKLTSHYASNSEALSFAVIKAAGDLD